ncbi:hypothetical protein VHEMI04602 [[Torrubiella] hemipterigena]|uniref:lytic cellulose monooxygenase (C4-dehydrogenating) n=1 Tax=[Torrubiella] hemipterigena TaxID=1531966 RepID=A0A0A1TEE3_9HYPO|nr:hypothetical protein VHEMI04602 [[Torrubiella] hemipterigena]
MATTPAAGDGWFKIWEDGYDEEKKTWCVDRLIANKGLLSVDLPTGLPAGYYLVRPEVLALHNADKGDPQFYAGCAQVHIEDGPSGPLHIPAEYEVSIPGYVDAKSPGVNFNIYKKPMDKYQVPGPKVYIPSVGKAGKAALTKEKQQIGNIPDDCLLKNANWCGKAIGAYSGETGCWIGVKDCWTQSKDCWKSAPPSGGANCAVWDSYCTSMEDECNSGSFRGPPKFSAKEKLAPVPGAIPKPWGEDFPESEIEQSSSVVLRSVFAAATPIPVGGGERQAPNVDLPEFNAGVDKPPAPGRPNVVDIPAFSSVDRPMRSQASSMPTPASSIKSPASSVKGSPASSTPLSSTGMRGSSVKGSPAFSTPASSAPASSMDCNGGMEPSQFPSKPKTSEMPKASQTPKAGTWPDKNKDASIPKDCEDGKDKNTKTPGGDGWADKSIDGSPSTSWPDKTTKPKESGWSDKTKDDLPSTSKTAWPDKSKTDPTLDMDCNGAPVDDQFPSKTTETGPKKDNWAVKGKDGDSKTGGNWSDQTKSEKDKVGSWPNGKDKPADRNWADKSKDDMSSGPKKHGNGMDMMDCDMNPNMVGDKEMTDPVASPKKEDTSTTPIGSKDDAEEIDLPGDKIEELDCSGGQFGPPPVDEPKSDESGSADPTGGMGADGAVPDADVPDAEDAPDSSDDSPENAPEAEDPEDAEEAEDTF